MVLLFDLTNNVTTILSGFLILLGTMFTGLMTYLTYKKTTKIEKNTDGLVTKLIESKDETIKAGKDELKKADDKIQEQDKKINGT